MAGATEAAQRPEVDTPAKFRTLAMNGILQGAALLYDNGTPRGSSSPILSWFMTGHLAGIVPAVIYGPLYHAIAEQAEPREWSPELVRAVEAQRRRVLPSDALAERTAWRDKRLMLLAAHKARTARDDDTAD